MTGARIPDQHGARYDDTAVGSEFSGAMTITETHLVLGAGLIGDFNPLHVNAAYAGSTRYEGRILHGMMTAAIMGAPLGMRFRGTAIGFLEHNVRFLAPVYPGDTLTTTWTVTDKLDKPKHAGGVVVLRGECRNQHGIAVASAESKMLVGSAGSTRKSNKRSG